MRQKPLHERPTEKAASRLAADLRRTHHYAPMASKSEVLNLLHWAADEWPVQATAADARGLSLQLQAMERRRGPEAALKAVTSSLGLIPQSRLANPDKDAATIAYDLLGEMLDKTEPASS